VQDSSNRSERGTAIQLAYCGGALPKLKGKMTRVGPFGRGEEEGKVTRSQDGREEQKWRR